ncbi:MAG: type II toxin-antitoxin system RelE/ParE family toxin [Saprospiraceae bacterium]
MPKLLTTKTYERQLLKFRKKHPELREQYFKTLQILEVNPYHPSLRLHRLQGKLKEYFSVSVNMKYRIMIDFVIQDDMIILVSIGGHDELRM